MSRLAFLRRYLDDAGEPAECELCAGPLEREHRHVVELRARRILCACMPCTLLFDGPSTRRFRAIPNTVRREAPFSAGEAWDALGLVEGSFVLFGSAEQQWIAVEPGPAGAAERVLDREDGGADARASLMTFFERLRRDSESQSAHDGQEGRP
jgi:hypothetical protein